MAEPMRGAAHLRVVLQIFAGVVVSWWLLFWFLNPLTDGKDWLNKIAKKVNSKFLGTEGDKFMLERVPFVLLAFIGFGAFELKRRIKSSIRARGGPRKRRTNIWSTPLIVRGPFGILTLLDLVLILTVLFITLWYIIKRSVKLAERVDAQQTKPGDPEKWVQKVEKVGIMIGIAIMIPLSLLWIPVSRGSPILKVIGVPFESAVKYHIWLGSLTVFLVLAHGVLMICYFIKIGEANKEGLFSWHTKEIAIIPGLLALLVGLVMFLTALNWVRRRSYDIFFSVHHLYLAFLLFFAFHAPWFVDYIIVPVLFFFLDRFMRMVQSRKMVDVLSARVLGAGAIELTVAKPAGPTYHALSFLYVRLPSVSKLMWHPFSVASSPLDGTNNIVIYIKPLGGFTKNLHDLLVTSNHAQQSTSALYKCPFSFKVGLEGPYGSESMFYLRYKSLVMVAGGIGVTPFLAILRDLLHRHRLQLEDLPDSVHVIFCVKNSRELHLLDTLVPDSILPGYEDCLNISVAAYVTAETNSQDGQVTMTPAEEADRWTVDDDPVSQEDIVLYSSSPNPMQEMSRFGSAGDTLWVTATFAATLAGFFVSFGVASLKYSQTEVSGPIRVMMYMVSIFWGVVVCGGGVILLWACSARRSSDSKVIAARLSCDQPPPREAHDSDVEKNGDARGRSLWRGNVTFGRRPNWEETFAEMDIKYRDEDVGVMVSGVLPMQQDVARHCRRRSFQRSSTSAFHYHSVSFDL